MVDIIVMARICNDPSLLYKNSRAIKRGIDPVRV